MDIRVFDDEYTQPVLELYGNSAPEGIGWLEIFVWLSNVGREDVTVNFKIKSEAGDTATEGDDYRSIDDDSMTIPAGDRVGSTIVTLVNDSEEEDDETFSFTVTAASGADLPDNVTATQTILDDDTSVVVEEGDETGEDFTVHLRTQPTSDVTVTLTGHAGTDVRLSSETRIFTPENWEEDQTVTVTAVHDDDAVDDEETLTMTSSGGGFEGVMAMVAVTIIDDDEAVTLRIADTQPVSESVGEAVFEVMLSRQIASEVTVRYATEDVTARGGVGLFGGQRQADVHAGHDGAADCGGHYG